VWKTKLSFKTKWKKKTMLMETTTMPVQAYTTTTLNTIPITHQSQSERRRPATAASPAVPSTGPASPAQQLPAPPRQIARNTNSAMRLTVKPNVGHAQDMVKLVMRATWTMGALTVVLTIGCLVVFAGRVFSDI
jgi:hypothetical protein